MRDSVSKSSVETSFANKATSADNNAVVEVCFFTKKTEDVCPCIVCSFKRMATGTGRATTAAHSHDNSGHINNGVEPTLNPVRAADPEQPSPCM